MRKEINITKTCQLEIETEPESTFLGWKYAIGDGGSGGASTFATLETDTDFNRLALHAPLVQRMTNHLFKELETGSFHYDEVQQLLADIAELETE